MSKFINEATVPLFIALLSGFFWLGTLSRESSAHGEHISKLETQCYEVVVSINNRLSHLEGHLGIGDGQKK